MNVRELKKILEDLDDDFEVRLAHQPSWPFEYSIAEVVVMESDRDQIDEIEQALTRDADDLTDDDKCSMQQQISELEDENVTVVYIAEGSQIGYLPGHVTRELGWGRSR